MSEDYKRLRMLTREAYSLWQCLADKIKADAKIKRRMRSKKVQRLFRLERKTLLRYLRRAQELEYGNH